MLQLWTYADFAEVQIEAHPESSKESVGEVLERNALKRKTWAFPVEQARKEKACTLMGYQGYGACPAWMKDDGDAATTGQGWRARDRQRSFVGLMAAFPKGSACCARMVKRGVQKLQKQSHGQWGK